MKILIQILFLLFSSISFASNFKGQTFMNGIHFKDYLDFPKNWSLVTIRFRKDTGEMRLTYANDIALTTLKKGSIDYPDGAVFAKTGIYTVPDTQFPSSIVPMGIRRYQFMVRNQTKYASTHGWGYALFDSDGKTFPEDPQKTQDACYACHTMVENRGDVFSTPFSFTEKAKFITSSTFHQPSKIIFETLETSSLPKEIKKYIPSQYSKIRMIKNKVLRDKIFQGTIDELRPLLEAESIKSKLPGVFTSTGHDRFLIIFFDKNQNCPNEAGLKIIMTSLEKKIVTEELCTHD